MYRFAFRPLWILSHLFAVAVVVSFVLLGLWQLDRHDQRAERNATVEARAELPPVPVAEVLAEVDDTDAARFRSVTATGSYADGTLLVDNRSKDGLPGAWVLAPLRLESGQVLVVNRGFQFPDGDGTVRPTPSPAGPVSLQGTVTTWEGEGCGVRTDDAGDPVGMACLRRSAAEDAFGAPVLPVVVQRQVSEPAEPTTLTPVPLPELDAGPHRSYAVQWFIFAAIVAIVYPLILRRVASGRGTLADDDGAAPEPAPVGVGPPA